MATPYEYYISGDDAWRGIPCVATTDKLGQTFTPQIEHTIEKIRLKLYRINSPGVLNVYVYATNEEGYPTGNALCSGTTDGSTLTTATSGSFRDILLGEGAILSADIKYAIILMAPNAVLSTDYVCWRIDSVSATYAGGDAIQRPDVDSVDQWQTRSGMDCMFVEYGFDSAPSEPTNPSPAHQATGVDWSAKGLSWDDGGGADTYNVYFGLTGALEPISSAQSETSITVSDGDIPFPEEGEPGAAFYWRVDATNAGGTTEGSVWYFDARPAKASNPTPEDAYTAMTLDWAEFLWE